MKNLKDQDLELQNAGSESLEKHPPTIKKTETVKNKKKVKKSKKASKAGQEVPSAAGDSFKGYNLVELNIPSDAYPQKTKLNLGAHGYTVTASLNGAALCLQL